MNTLSHKFAQWPGKLRDFLLGAMGIGCIPIAIYLCLDDKLQAAGMLFTVGLLLCVFSSLSRFESIKGLGVEAKMVALTNKLSEAEELLTHMRNMVGLMADTSFQIIGKMGRWDAEIPKPDMLRIVENFEQLLIALGEPTQSIERRLEPWHQGNTRDLAQSIVGALHSFARYQNQVITDEARQRDGSAVFNTDENAQRFDRNSEFLKRANEIWQGDIDNFPDAVVNLIRESNNAAPEHLQWLQKELNPALEELRFYLKHKNFKDRFGWMSRPYLYEIPLDFTRIRPLN